MSRVVNLSISETAARDHCQSRNIGVSALERLPDGGFRLVCTSGLGAEEVRRTLKTKLLKDPVRRTAHGMERSPIEGWPR